MHTLKTNTIYFMLCNNLAVAQSDKYDDNYMIDGQYVKII